MARLIDGVCHLGQKTGNGSTPVTIQNRPPGARLAWQIFFDWSGTGSGASVTLEGRMTSDAPWVTIVTESPGGADLSKVHPNDTDQDEYPFFPHIRFTVGTADASDVTDVWVMAI